MNIVYSSDENYVQHMGVSMLSLFKSNQDAPQLDVYIIANDISAESRSKLEQLAQPYHRTLHWIDFTPFRNSLTLNMEWPISISSYARLFLPKMLPDSCQRVLYLDCDTVICDSLQSLWQTDMQGYSVAAVMDLIAPSFKNKIGLMDDDIYVNAGILLIDIQRWRDTQILDKFLSYITDCRGRVTHHDQGVINHTLNGQIYVLHPRYNAMTPFFTSKYKKLLRFYQLKKYYEQDTLLDATRTPAIIHYTPEFVGRVWETGCKHPKANLYLEQLSDTCWKGNIKQPKALPLKIRLLYWVYKKQLY
jgi:lipopolysaccharide biosynthesis glycosyltransferase